jgi:hypothetical protein
MLDDVEICIIAHSMDNIRFTLFKECIKSVKEQDTHTRFIYDDMTPQEAIIFASNNGIEKIEHSNRLDINGKFTYAYNSSKYKYVSLIGDDDAFFPAKTIIQRSIMEGNNFSFVTCGIIKQQVDEFGNKKIIDYMEPHYDPDYYFIDCLCHTWLINKILVPELPDMIYADTDVIYPSLMFKYGNVALVNIPLVIYNKHNKTVSNDNTKIMAKYPDVYRDQIPLMNRNKLFVIRPSYLMRGESLMK